MIRLVRTGSFPHLTEKCTNGFSDRVQIKEFFAKEVKQYKGTEFTVDLTALVEEKGLYPDVTAGLSLGEYCAIEAAKGVMQ